jgi:hypothetical protein
MAVVLSAIYVLMAARLVELDGLGRVTRSLLIIFPALPPPLCFLLVRTYTRMLENERAQELGKAWAVCEEEFLQSPERQLVERRLGGLTARPQAQAPTGESAALFDRGMRAFVLRRHRELLQIFSGVAKGEDERTVVRRMARTEFRTAGLDHRSYDLPILFFSCAYLIGLQLVLPLLESYARGGELWLDFPLGKNVSVPLMVFQVGVLGGAAYAAFNLISRFLSRDITPRLFMVSGVRLILAPVGAFLLYLSPFISVPGASETLPMANSQLAVLAYFVAGGFPFALLWTKAEDVFSRLDVFKQRLMAGKRSTSLMEGITIFVAQRLSEEGIDVIQHLAFCDPADLARRTRYSDVTVADWKDQAILYLLAGDCVVSGPEAPGGRSSPSNLYDLLVQRAGIRSASALVRRVWEPVSGSAPQVRTDIELFLEELGLLPTDAIPGAKQRRESLAFLFARLCEDAAAIQPELRPPAHDPHPLGDITHSDRP